MERPQLKRPRRAADPASLGRRLVARVRRLKTALRLVLWLEHALALLLMLLAVSVLGLFFILYAAPSPRAVWLFTGAGVAVVGYLFVKFIYARRRRVLSDLAASAWIERSIPRLQDRLITAMEFSEGQRLASGETLASLFDPSLVAAFFQQTEAVIRRAFLGRVLLRGRFLVLCAVLGLSLLLFENSHYFSPYTAQDLQRIYLDTHLALLRGLGVVFVVEPGDVTLARGEDLTVKAYGLRPGRGRDLEIFYRAEGQSWESAPMDRADGSDYSFTFQSLSQPLEYFVSDDQAKSQVYSIRLVERPELASLRVQLIHPAYTGLGTVVGREGQGEIEALSGTFAKVVVQFRQLMKEVELTLGVDEPEASGQAVSRLPMSEAAGSWKGEFVVRRPGWYRMSATNPEGYSTGRELTYPIRLLEDATPQVEITYPTGIIDFVRTEEFPEMRAGKRPKLPIRYEAKDDFGIARVELHYTQRGGGVSAHRILAEFGYGEKAISGDYQWDLESLWGGASVIYHLRVYDHLALKEEAETGQTEHYGESGRLELFWGMDRSPPPEERPEQTTQREPEESERGEANTDEEIAQGLGELAEQVAQLRQQQESIDQEAQEESRTEERSSPQTPEDLARRQERVADEAARVRRELRSKAGEIRRKGRAAAEQLDSAAFDPELQTQTERQAKLEKAAEQVREVADVLEEQRIEQTPDGFKTRSGIEGEMRLNQQRLAQRRFEEAQQKGQQLEEQLAQIEQELRQLAQSLSPGGAASGEAGSAPGSAQAGPMEQQAESAQDAGRGAAGSSGGPSGSFASFDDYRPSQWDPPPMKDLGRKGDRLGEFIDVQPQRDPFGDTPPEERYPLKYEGMVEQYFQALANSGS